MRKPAGQSLDSCIDPCCASHRPLLTNIFTTETRGRGSGSLVLGTSRILAHTHTSEVLLFVLCVSLLHLAGEEIHVGLRVESGTFASETPQLFLFAGLLQLKGTCETAWMSGSRAGPTSAVCGSVSAVRKSEEVQEVVTLSNTDLATTNIYATAA